MTLELLNPDNAVLESENIHLPTCLRLKLLYKIIIIDLIRPVIAHPGRWAFPPIKLSGNVLAVRVEQDRNKMWVRIPALSGHHSAHSGHPDLKLAPDTVPGIPDTVPGTSDSIPDIPDSIPDIPDT